MSEFENPYQPSDLPDDQSQSHVAKTRTPIPAIVLMVLCSISIVLDVITLVGFGLLAVNGVQLGVKDMLPCVWSAIHLVAVTIIVIGAGELAFYQSRRWVKTSAIVACIPMLTPLVILGIPFGIWTLSFLDEEDFQNAFGPNRPAG